MDFDREQRPPGNRLLVDTILQSLDDGEADQLREALLGHTYSNDVVARTVCNQTDHTVSGAAVRNWRAKYRR